MQRTDGPQTPFEVYCYNCQTSFAVGTRTCVHCGHRIGSVRPGPEGGVIPNLLDPVEEEEEVVAPSLGRRLGGVGIWVLIAVGATLMRLCEG